MLHTIVDARALIAMVIAAVVGAWGVYEFPVNPDNVFLALIALQNPPVFQDVDLRYATLWFTTPFFAASIALSVVAIVAYQRPQTTKQRPLPPYQSPEARPAPSLVLGETHGLKTGLAARASVRSSCQRSAVAA